MSPIIKGLIAAIVFSGVLAIGWSYYRPTLEAGRDASAGAKQLNALISSGVPIESFQTIEGKTINFKDFKDKVVILNFWASWCDPCVEEFPAFMKLLDAYPNDLVMIAMSADNGMTELTDFLKAFKATQPKWDKRIIVSWDKDKKFREAFGTEVLPETYIFSYDNKFVKKISGIEKWDSKESMGFFKSLIEDQR